MARIRTIKPEFFTSEDIVGLSPFARLLYVALWCEADREGRFQWKPRTFKMRYFPADSFDIDPLCDELREAGMVVLYGDGLSYIPTFSTHQHINPREAASILPDPHASATRQPRVSDTPLTVQELSLTRREEGKGKEGLPTANAVGADSLPAADHCPHNEIIAAYHDALPNCTPVRVWNDQRKAMLRQRWREDAKRQRIEWWQRFFAYVADSRFLTGRAETVPGRDPFVADLEWLIRPQNFAKVIEGKYHRDEVTA